MAQELAGQVAIITGGSRGIGRGIALAFAGAGADVAFCHLDDPTGEAEVVASIEALGRRAFARGCDVGDIPALRRFIAEAEATLGPCDVLVNNAGMNNCRGAITEVSEERFDIMVAVHLKAMVFAAQAVLPGMAARGRGRIINTASQLAFKGAANSVVYCMVKAGVVGLTRSLAREVAPQGVLVNAIAPGPVTTELTAQHGPDWSARIGATLPVGRVGEVPEIAPTALLLAGPGGSFYCGACLSPNGGDLMH